jgi:hypothetical protein
MRRPAYWRPWTGGRYWARPGPFYNIGYGWRGGFGWTLYDDGYYYNPLYDSLYPYGLPWWQVVELLEREHRMRGYSAADFAAAGLAGAVGGLAGAATGALLSAL